MVTVNPVNVNLAAVTVMLSMSKRLEAVTPLAEIVATRPNGGAVRIDRVKAGRETQMPYAGRPCGRNVRKDSDEAARLKSSVPAMAHLSKEARHNHSHASCYHTTGGR